MNTQPRFRLKIFLTMVVVLCLSLVVQGRAWFHAGDLFFGSLNVGAFFLDTAGPLVLFALPIILVVSFVLFQKLKFLEEAVGRLARGEVLPEAEAVRAKRDLMAIPTWVFLTNLGGFGTGIVFKVLSDPGDFGSLIGVLDVFFELAGAGVFAFFLLGLFEFFLEVPRKLLHVTKVDPSLGKRRRRHRTTTAFVLCLAAWVILAALNMGVSLSTLQHEYGEALLKIAQGEDRAAVSKEFFDDQRKFTHPDAGLAQKDDILALKIDPNLVGDYYLPPFFFIFGLGVLMWWIGTRHQSRQLAALRDRMDAALKGGDLGQKLEVIQYDEVGELASAINVLTEIQAERLARLTAAAHAVEDAFRPLHEATEEAARASATILASSNKIAGLAQKELGSVGAAEASLAEALGSFEAIGRSVEAQAGYVAEASSAMTEMASSIASVTKTTDEARDLTLRLQSSSQAGAQSLGASVEAIRAIEAASKEVNALTAAIAKISAQTNLLAMNAAIEAAHAGDTGAGFAVVAEEVRNLALSSSESNKKIKQKTAEMLALVGNGVKLTTEVGEAFQRINADVAATATLVSEINSAMQEQNVGTKQILQSTASLVDSSHVIQQSAEAQKTQNAHLKESVGRITASFQTIHQGAQDAARDGDRIRETVVRLEAVSKEGRKVVDELSALARTKG